MVLFRGNFRPEVGNDVISGANVGSVKFGDSRSNRFPVMRLPHFVTNDSDAGRRILWQWGKMS